MFTCAQAQHLRVTDDALDKQVLTVTIEGAALLTFEMQQELGLNPEQQAKVGLLNTERYRQIQEMEQLYKEDALLRSKAIFGVHLKNDKALEEVLTQEQLLHYLALEGRATLPYVSEGDE